MRRHWYNSDDYSPERRWHSLKVAKSALVLVDLINWQAAEMMARVCISVISGYVMPRRTPRWPSIGLNS